MPLPFPRLEYRLHTVAQGESLSAIAQKYATTMWSIISANPQYPSLKWNPDYIQVGWVLRIPT